MAECEKGNTWWWRESWEHVEQKARCVVVWEDAYGGMGKVLLSSSFCSSGTLVVSLVFVACGSDTAEESVPSCE